MPAPLGRDAAADPVALAALAVDVATRAADLLTARLHDERAEVDTKSSLTDMVTEVDRASEALIVDALLDARPDDGLIGEEGSTRSGRSGVRWVVDPLDGTTDYLYGHPGFAVSIAAEDEGGPLAGAVVDPLHGDTFAASRGGGATRNGRRIACRPTTDLRMALVATGFSYDPERRRRQAGVLERVLPAVRDIRRMGAASVDLCWVACGRVDAYYERGLAPWDFAAAALVAQEAGAVTCDLDGGPPSTEFVMAAPAGIAAPLRDLLRTAGAADA